MKQSRCRSLVAVPDGATSWPEAAAGPRSAWQSRFRISHGREVYIRKPARAI